MANVVSGNTIYVDTGSNADISNTSGTKVLYVVVSATSSNAILKLEDTTATTLKGDFRVATSGDSKIFDFSNAPLYFPGGIRIDTCTNCVATLVYRAQGVQGGS